MDFKCRTWKMTQEEKEKYNLLQTEEQTVVFIALVKLSREGKEE